MSTIRIGVIGAGAVTSTIHLPILTRRSDLFTIVGLCDLNLAAVDALGDRFGIAPEARFSDPEQLLNSGSLDAVLILNSGSHADLVSMALLAGLEVFCEKPLAYTKREMREIRDAIEQSGKRLMIGYMKSHDPAVERAAELISRDGAARTVDVLVLHPSGDSQLATSEVSINVPDATHELSKKFSTKREEIQREALGPLAEQIGDLYSEIICGSIIHEFSVLRSIGLEITEIDWVDRWPKTSVTESIVIWGRTAEGVRISIRWFYLENFPEYQEEVRWVGETSSHHLLFPSPYFLRVPTVLTTTRSNDGVRETCESASYHGSFERELETFHDLVSSSSQRGSDLRAGESDLRVCQMIAKKIAEIEGLAIGGDLGS